MSSVSDLPYVLGSVAFFVVCAVYAVACGKLR
jgi:hypothetical protein